MLRPLGENRQEVALLYRESVYGVHGDSGSGVAAVVCKADPPMEGIRETGAPPKPRP